ncbi:MAG TPA: carboxylating nicotinate-nucleotide diphosphorylase [Leucothrix mucor]|uniref:Probable nicotinate-nucleotide pyrophosphorylase [carboxylating] n=1 Tax=Leucothrix mucor TaxID=45248 RepID=A0A7V2SY09_LEUMU|nr:carboxylating nicotinate-nucleotide diphosphorylase [Leucothrix mucor]
MELAENIKETVQRALAEDIGSGDVTAGLIDPNQTSEAHVICREIAILSGKDWFDEVFRQIDDRIKIEWNYDDADVIEAGATLCTLSGNSRALLSGERVALNLLQILSATATQTDRYAELIGGFHARILDTRKTLPNLRQAQKYAVTCGAGKNHRMGLYDMILIKENHIMAAGSITNAIEQARKLHPTLQIEIETENLEEYAEASAANPNIIMLDNFSIEDMQEAVAQNEGKFIKLEASGNITLKNVRSIADTGVDFISIGDITKNIKAIDLSMRFTTLNSPITD